MRKMIAFRLNTEILAKLVRTAEKTGHTKTDLIERGIVLVLKQMDTKGRRPAASER
jgi:predicted DNA-binding protein